MKREEARCDPSWAEMVLVIVTVVQVTSQLRNMSTLLPVCSSGQMGDIPAAVTAEYSREMAMCSTAERNLNTAIADATNETALRWQIILARSHQGCPLPLRCKCMFHFSRKVS